MRHITLILCLSLGIAFPLRSNAAEWATLICKSGGSMKLTVRLDYDASIVDGTNLISGLRPAVVLDFKRPSGSAGSNGSRLGAGECAWPDRALNDSEESCMGLILNRSMTRYFLVEKYAITGEDRLSGDAIPVFKTNEFDRTKRTVTTSGKVFTAKVKNSGSGCMLLNAGDDDFPSIRFK